MTKNRQRAFRGLFIGIGAALIALLLWRTGVFQRWEWTTWSWRVKLFARPSPHSNDIRLILLDQASLEWGKEAMGLSWPWPREVYGPLLDFCRRGGARAAVFDVLFTEPSAYGVGDDLALAEAIRRAPPFVGALSLTESDSGIAAWPPEVKRRGIDIGNLDAWLETIPAKSAPVFPRSVFPIPEVAGAPLLGNVMDRPDEDSIFRRASLFGVFQGRPVPSLGLAAYILSPPPEEPPPADIRIEAGSLTGGDLKIPIDTRGRALIRYRGRNNVYRPLSAAAVIQSEIRLQSKEKPVVDPAELKDAYVFFGFSAPGLLDLRSTPLSPVAPGVFIHAAVLDNLLNRDFLRDAPGGLFIAVTALLSIAAGIAVALSRKAGESVVLSAVFIPLPLIIGFGAYPLGWWWPMVAGEAAVLLALAGAVVLNYATEGRQKAFIKGAFKHYLSSAVIEKLIEDPSQLQLGGERRELSIFFSDLEGFSSISEKLNPVELTALLNDYLSDMTDIILEEGGTLDKYEGDAIIAFWNAPLVHGNHALRACRTAIRCQRKLAGRRREFKERTGAELKMRIGINTGEVVVGNMGSRERFDYTVLGDAANLASRLEGANKVFGTYLMVSEATWNAVGEAIVGRRLGRIRVVGRKTPVTVYEPGGLKGDELPPYFDDFQTGLDYCDSREWEKALEVFEGLKDDPAARSYAARCRKLIQNPEEDWDGIWKLTAK